MKRTTVTRYSDFYGCIAYLYENPNGTARLRIYTDVTKVIDKSYNTVRGAKIALGKYSDGWHEIDM